METTGKSRKRHAGGGGKAWNCPKQKAKEGVACAPLQFGKNRMQGINRHILSIFGIRVDER